ncbi:MAG: metallophosphoesterase family protein [Deltaproteobacteria bacterium]|nr:metallophosphoesterase family protein [Deltaproteobacteria bacterium]
MFKFIHAADIHLDSPLRGLARYETAPVDAIRNATRKAFENLVEYAIDEEVDFILMAGDLYDGDWKDYSTGIFFSQQMGKLAKAGIHFYAVSGNHDAANKMTRSLAKAPNFTLFKSSSPQTETIEELEVAIHGQSFSTRHVWDNLAVNFPDAVSGAFNIGLLHTSLTGREGHVPYAPCSVDDLVSKRYQYWALGHIHHAEVVSEDPWIVFPGCIQGRHMNETGSKGCRLVTVDDGEVISVEEVYLDVFRWFQVSIDITDIEKKDAVWDKIRAAIADNRGLSGDSPFALRINLTGSAPVASSLAHDPEATRQQILALGAEVAGEDVWIEKVNNSTRGKRNLEKALAEGGLVAQILGEIIELPDDPSEVDGVSDLITEMKALPPEVFGDGFDFDLSDANTLKQVVFDAKELLINSLLAKGGEQ